MKQLTQAELLLVRVATEYRENPALWCPNGWGTMPGQSRWNSSETLTPGIIEQLVTICPDVALMRFGLEYGGDVTAEGARQLIYAHLNVEPKPESIWFYNDTEGRTIEQIIDMLESAAGVKVTTTAMLYEQLHVRQAMSKVASIGLDVILTMSHVGRLLA